MLEIEWNDDLAVDHGVVDEEHKSLIEMANRIFEIEHPEAHREELIDVVKALYRYMENHFEHEEELMELAHAPGRQAHAEMHRVLISEMNHALRDHSDLREYTVVLRKLMGDWFVKHIVGVDRKIASELVEAGEQTAAV